MSDQLRRVVTGHDARGRAVIQEDGAVPRVQRIGGEHGPLFFEVWNTRETPARIDGTSGEPAESGISLAPPKNGTRIRVLDIPPDDESLEALSPEQAKAHFAEFGGQANGRGLVLRIAVGIQRGGLQADHAHDSDGEHQYRDEYFEQGEAAFSRMPRLSHAPDRLS